MLLNVTTDGKVSVSLTLPRPSVTCGEKPHCVDHGMFASNSTDSASVRNTSRRLVKFNFSELSDEALGQALVQLSADLDVYELRTYQRDARGRFGHGGDLGQRQRATAKRRTSKTL